MGNGIYKRHFWLTEAEENLLCVKVCCSASGIPLNMPLFFLKAETIIKRSGINLNGKPQMASHIIIIRAGESKMEKRQFT